MTKLKKFGIVVLSIPLLAGLIYATRNVVENYKTGDWSESCGTIFTNPHYRECEQRRVWIPRLRVVSSQPLPSKDEVGPWTKYSKPDSKPQIIEIYGGETLHIAPVPAPIKNSSGIDLSAGFVPIIYLGHNQKFALACGNVHEPGYMVTEMDKGTVSCP